MSVMELESIRRDLEEARGFPDKEMLDNAYAKVSPEDWPIYSVFTLEGDEPSRSVLPRTGQISHFTVVLAKPYAEAFDMARTGKITAFFVSFTFLWIAFVSLTGLLGETFSATSFGGTVSTTRFVVCFISLALAVESGLITALFHLKQLQIERAFPIGILTLHRKAYNRARGAKNGFLIFSLACSFIAMGVFVAVAFDLMNKTEAMAVCYVNLSLAIVGALSAVFFHIKQMHVAGGFSLAREIEQLGFMVRRSYHL